ncbi:MAG: ACP S-malonyltransferase [Anaerolineae bacterium]|nr:ACP S-malonyltransferase [Anaerolineae bacterium]
MINWSQTAFVFPGQGSQVVGMGKDIAEAYPAAREVFDEADAVLGYSLSRLCFDGPESDLNDTYYTQPALYVCSIAILRALQSRLPAVRPGALAGHSLGELTALAAAGVFGFAEGLRLVQTRGQVMRDAGTRNPGAMAALLGLDAPQVRELCARASGEAGGVLVLANDNCPGQIVISGESAVIDHAITIAKDAGARRAIKLAVSIASHSPLMTSAAEAFAQALSQIDFQEPAVPVYANVTAAPLTTGGDIHRELEMQLTHSVRWTESIQAMVAAGFNSFVEIGPKDVLTGMIRRIESSANTTNLNTVDNLDAFIQSFA